MKFLNKQTFATLFFILIINSQIIIAFEKVNIKKTILSRKSKSKDVCKENVRFNYVTFFITAILRINSSFVEQVSTAVEKLISVDKLSSICKETIFKHLNYFKNGLLKEKEQLQNDLISKLNEIRDAAYAQGIKPFEIVGIENAYFSQIPKKICQAVYNPIYFNNEHATSENKRTLYILRYLDSWISDINRNPDNPYFITYNEIQNVLSECSILGFLFNECDYQKYMLSEINSMTNGKNIGENFYNVLINYRLRCIDLYTDTIRRISIGEKYLNFDCDLLPDYRIENELCVKSDVILNIKSVWMTIKSIPDNNILSQCLSGMVPANIINIVFNKLFNSITKILTEIFGFLIFRGMKLLWNLGVIFYYLYQAYNNNDNVELRSEYLGEVAGAAIRIVIDLESTSLSKKFRRYKK